MPRKSVSLVLAAGLLAVGVPPHAASAQDVEMLAQHYGTRPPEAYYEQLRRDPAAYRWSGRAWRPVLRFDDPREPAEASAGPAAVAGGGVPGGPARTLGPREGPVEGVVSFPLLLGLYSDSSDPVAPFTGQQIHEEYFVGPNPNGATLTEFYEEISFGRLMLTAETFDWTRSDLTNDQVAGGSNGLAASDDVGEFIIDLLMKLDDGTVDWGRFDDDGPDGIPNSGDDDGFIDVLAVMHPGRGAECTSADLDVWSHKWTLGSSAGQIYATQSLRPNGSPIFADNYVIGPSRACPGSDSPTGIMEIGTMAHEVGHGFGLPDLYATSPRRHAGIGRWGLMGSGSWGCQDANTNTDSNAAKPCGMTAWTKEALGWADVVTLDRDLDHGLIMLEPVETSNAVLRVEAGDGSGVYYLLENRQLIGTDSDLYGPGLLVWQISPFVVFGSWALNQVNFESDQMGVWLRQADGDNDLARVGRGRGDNGDPFPGIMQNTEFNAGSIPSATTNFGTSPAGVTLLDIREVGEQIQFRLLTRYQQITLDAQGNVGSDGLFRLDGNPLSGLPVSFQSAPFERHTIEATGGEETGDGFRNGFIDWETTGPRIREWQTGTQDAVLTATYGNAEVRFDVELNGPVVGVTPGSIVTSPSSDQGWISQGTDVTVMAQPTTGFSFREWTGDLAGLPNPFEITLNEPTTGGASFDVIFQVAETPSVVGLEAAVAQTIVFTTENANQPVTWTRLGNLPPGLNFMASVGEIRGAALQTGSFPLTISATDALGLSDQVLLTIEVTPPSVGLLEMAALFLTGSELEPPLRAFLDLQGNRSGAYDLADFRAYVLSNPDAPLSASVLKLTEPVQIPMFVRREGSR